MEHGFVKKEASRRKEPFMEHKIDIDRRQASGGI